VNCGNSDIRNFVIFLCVLHMNRLRTLMTLLTVHVTMSATMFHWCNRLFVNVLCLLSFWLENINQSHCMLRQETQLPLRNRASAVHFFVAKLFSITVMTYWCISHLRNLHTANLLRTQWVSFSMRPQYVGITCNPCKHPHKLSIAVNYMTTAIVSVCRYLVLRNCFRKPRKDVQDER